MPKALIIHQAMAKKKHLKAKIAKKYYARTSKPFAYRITLQWILLIHLNINSLQNKFEELKGINDQLKSHIIFISETKIDKSYPNDQFKLPGYHMYRRERKKGGGGLLAYFHSNIPSKEIKLPKKYKNNRSTGCWS